MSYAVQPARRVASKNGDRRYQGPKYRVALFASISGRSFAMAQLLRGRWGWLNHGSIGMPDASPCSPPACSGAIERQLEAGGALGERDRLVRVHERHRDDGGGPAPPFGLDRDPLAVAGTIGRKPAVADVLPEARRVDRRCHLADPPPRLVDGRPLDVVETRERIAVEFDAVDPAGDAGVTDPAQRRHRDRGVVREVPAHETIQTQLEWVVLVGHVGAPVEDRALDPTDVARAGRGDAE